MNPLNFDLNKVRANVAVATTEDLMDRAAAFRPEFEPEALELIDAELRSRGIVAAQLAAYREEVEAKSLRRADGTILHCTFCRRPAVSERWAWHRLWGKVPVFLRWVRCCAEHGS